MKLYEIANEIQHAVSLVSDETGELSQEAFAKLESLEMQLGEKLDGCCKVMRQYEAEAAAYRCESERLLKQAETARSNVIRLKNYMQDCLEKLGLEKQQTALFKLRIATNPPSVQYDGDPRDLPADCRKVTVDIDKRKLLDWHKQGATLPPGVQVVQTRSLRIS